MVHFISPLSDRIYKDTDETATAIPTTYQYSRSWFRIEFSCSISNRNHQVRHFSWNVNSSGVSKTPLSIYDWAFLRKKLNGLKLLINFEKTFHRLWWVLYTPMNILITCIFHILAIELQTMVRSILELHWQQTEAATVGVL